MANVTVLLLVAFKNSPLRIVGLSYERINAFHRWVGRLIVSIFVVHGILIGYFQCVQNQTPFITWLGRRDVLTGISALSCLLLLIVLYKLQVSQLI
jgi:Ferric reductase like transmembrane component